MNQQTISKMIGNQLLASTIYHSVSTAVDSGFVHLKGGASASEVIDYSVNSAIRDIEKHPRSKLLRRLVEFGTQLPPRNPVPIGNKTILSNAECGMCVEFIYSQLVNRFRSELSELIAIEPCMKLVEHLRENGFLSSDIQFFWGETIQTRRKFIKATELGDKIKWGAYAKGSDGLLVKQPLSNTHSRSYDRLKIQGVIEVKSMTYTKKKVLEQIDQHIERLSGGLKLNDVNWPSDKLIFAPLKTDHKSKKRLQRIVVSPSIWKKESDQFQDNETEELADGLPLQAQFYEFMPNCWKIELPWSLETLNQAAYEMTFWYMTELYKSVHLEDDLSQNNEDPITNKTRIEAIKVILHNMRLRPLSNRQRQVITLLNDAYDTDDALSENSEKDINLDDESNTMQ